MLREYILHYNGKETDGEEENVPIQIIRSSRKTIGLQVKENGEVLARIPVRLSERELKEFLEQHRNWVWEQEENNRCFGNIYCIIGEKGGAKSCCAENDGSRSRSGADERRN